MHNIRVWQLIVGGLVLILIANTFQQTILNIQLHHLLADVGALIVMVGVLQFVFDEKARKSLIDHIIKLVSSTEWLIRAGIDRATDRSHSILDSSDDLIAANELTIGIHYSNNAVDRYTEIIRDRISRGKITTILISAKGSPGLIYLASLMNTQSLDGAVDKLSGFIFRNFESSQLVIVKETKWLFRYNFIATDAAIWVIFSPNAPGRVQRIPAVRAYRGSPLYDFFRRDIDALCKEAANVKAAN